MSVFLCFCLCLTLIPDAYASGSESLTLSVGDRRTLYASSSSGTVISYGWYSNNINAVQIEGDVTSSSCTIKVIGYSSSEVIVRCDMYYQKLVGGRIATGSDFKDYVIRINGSVKEYTINYYANGGSGAPASQTKTEGVSITLSSIVPTHSSSSVGSYTVSLNPNGGSVSTNTLTAARTRRYSFKNWNTRSDGSGISYSSGERYNTDADLTLYAQWNSSITTGSVTLPKPTRSGYTFMGWATSSGASSGVTGSYTPSGNVTLYAVWQEGEEEVVLISEASFPDANFRSIVRQFDKDNDGYLNSGEMARVTDIDCYGKQISSLEGVEYFTELKMLDCGSNQLTTLDVSNNTLLEYLNCGFNQLTTLDVSRNTLLERLHCSGNQLTTLDVSNNTLLEKLSCNSRKLTTLDVSNNTLLKELDCNESKLTTIDVSNNTLLERLSCYQNQLTALDISRNTLLKKLICDHNQLTTLDISNNTKIVGLVENYSPKVTNGWVIYNGTMNSEDCYIRYDQGVFLFISSPDFILPSALTAIESEAFAGGEFASIYIPNGVVCIADDAFGTRDSLTIYGVPGSTAETFAKKHGFVFVSSVAVN